MLTTAKVSERMAVNYFVKNYHHQQKTRWSGQGAAKLGLSGEIDEEDFLNIVHGRSPDGREQLNARVVKQKERRAALDCTFSAPKSVSLMALVGGDSRLIDAHHKALNQVLALMERYAMTRLSEGDTRHRVNTSNLVIAQFDHIESRELDPHLHTHCLIMNTTQAQGKWYSLVNGEIFTNKKFLGMAYQSYLAAEVIKLGYEVEPRQHGQFEIKGFREQDKIAFSKRRQQIIALCGANSSWAEREKVWDKTRQRKQKISQDELVALWKQETADLGISFVQPKQPQVEVVDELANQKNLNSLLEDAIAHCSERSVAFKFEDVAKFILNEKLATDVVEIEPLLKQHPQILTLPRLEQYTTIAAVSREIATIELMKQGKEKVNPICHPEVIESQLEKTLLNSGQRQAVMMALTSRDSFVAWQGVAGAGKTFALNELKAIAKDAGYTVKGFAPSSMAAKVLSEELEIQGETVARLLVSQPPQQPEQNQIWIVDEAGLLSAKENYALLERANQLQARVLLVGDIKQLSGVEAGNPFKSLQQAGIQTAYLTQSNRQRNPDLKIAVDLIAENRIEAGFKQLEAIGSITEVSPDTKLEMIATEYMALTPAQRERTLILAGTNAEKLALTQVIRNKLKDSGSLGATAFLAQLQAKNLTKVQMRYTHNYEVGDVVIPIRSYKRRSLEKGQLYEVVDKNTDQLTLKAPNGKHLLLDTLFEKAVYQRDEIEIAVGDRLQWKKNDRQLQRRNGQEFVVTAIDGDIAQIKYPDSSRTETINLQEAQNLDYALVSTTYSSQGKTAEQVLISADYTIGQESFYVAVSRAKDTVKLFTEDKQYLLELAQKSKAQENALELLKKQVKQQLSSNKNEISIIIEEPVVSTVASPVLKTDLTVVSKTKEQQERSLPTPLVKPNLKKCIPKQAFWVSTRSVSPPNHIDQEHWKELVEKSAIHPDIATLNFESLHFSYIGGEHEAWERLMISEKLERTNTGRLSSGLIKAYSHLDAGGWWCDAGVDPRTFDSLKPGEKPVLKKWGCYKPNQPRQKKDDSAQIIEGKFIKYEHPPKIELSIFLLNVPDRIAKRIYAKHKVNPSDGDRSCGFWYCVWKHNIPITITEGAKKAASLLSQGHAAIGLPGISAGYRSPKDDQGQKIGKSYLCEELAVFATSNREINICFDYETKPETQINIKRDISVTGWLLQKQGARVKVVNLPGPDKGVDDFLTAQGPLAYEKVSHEATPLREWQRRNQQQRAAAIEPPRKFTLQERQQRLAASQQNLSPQNQTKEPKDDINCQQPQQPTTIRDRIINREDRPTERQNQLFRNQQSAVDSENRAVNNEPNREHERVESESHELLTAISRYVELEEQEVEQLRTDIERVNRSLVSGELRGQGTKILSRNTNRQNSAIVDCTESYVHSERVTRQLVNAISNFLETAAIESTINVAQLQSLIKNLQSDQYQKPVEAKPKLETAIAFVQMQSTLDAIANFIEQEVVSLTLAEVLLSFSEHLSQYQQQLVNQREAVKHLKQTLKEQATHNQAVGAIAGYAQLQEIEASTVVQTVQEFVEQLKHLHVVMLKSKAAVVSQKLQANLNAIANFMEQEATELALVEALPSFSKQLSVYQQHLEAGKTTLAQFEQLLDYEVVGHLTQKTQQTEHFALNAISDYVLIETVATHEALSALGNLKAQLGQSANQAMKDLDLATRSITLLVNYIKDIFLEEVATIEAVSKLNDQEFLLLKQNVVDYFQRRPPYPPALADKQCLQKEIEQINVQIQSLWQEQTKYVNSVNQLEKNLFYRWDKKYTETVAKIEKNAELINSFTTQKQQKEIKLKQWENQAQVYYDWKKEPRTLKMEIFDRVFNLPKIQERLRNIQLNQAIKIQSQQQHSRVPRL